MTKRDLAMQALAKALQLREEKGLGIAKPVNVFDFASSELGIEVRFVDLPSLEGMYTKKQDRPVILISSHRPPGRQAYSCAHELGHHLFGHSTKIDEYIEHRLPKNRFDPDEYLADQFANYFLMPKSLVNRAFSVRNWSPATSSPQQFYTVAGWIGVGYSTLIHQMRSSLRLISSHEAQKLLVATPKSIRLEIMGQEMGSDLIIVDINWTDRAVDAQTGDYLLLPQGVKLEGTNVCLVTESQEGSLFQCVTPGIGRFFHDSTHWASFVRVSRKNFVGRSLFRHLEDPEHDEGVDSN